MGYVILFLLVRRSLPSGGAAYQISQISTVSSFGSKLPAVGLSVCLVNLLPTQQRTVNREEWILK